MKRSPRQYIYIYIHIRIYIYIYCPGDCIIRFNYIQRNRFLLSFRMEGSCLSGVQSFTVLIKFCSIITSTFLLCLNRLPHLRDVSLCFCCQTSQKLRRFGQKVIYIYITFYAITSYAITSYAIYIIPFVFFCLFQNLMKLCMYMY